MLLELWYLTFFIGIKALNSPIVSTDYGDVQGLSETLNDGRVYHTFKGIPFASPPVGGKRFLKTDPPSSWEGVLNTTKYSPNCHQFIAPVYPAIGVTNKVSEDCLYLNVFVPDGVDAIVDPLPVIMYVHGGVYYIGAPQMYPGQELAVNGKVIVVTANYRVGPIGFLSTGDSNAPGNQGLWDTVRALEWVNKNIKHFGGDSSRITLMGHSAGAITVSNLMTSSKANHLFQRVLAISGSSTNIVSYTTLNKKNARILALAYQCSIISNKAMVACLREKDAQWMDIYGLFAPLASLGHLPSWVPVVDGDLLQVPPRLAHEAGAGQKHDFLLGTTQHDAAGFVYLNNLGLPQPAIINIAASVKLLEFSLNFIFKFYPNHAELVDAILEKYPDLLTEDDDYRPKVATKALTDCMFAAPAYLDCSLHARFADKNNGGSTYMYEYSHRQSFVGYQPWVNASHIDDLYSYFGDEFLSRISTILGGFDKSDHDVSDYTQKYFANFAYSGNPNKGPHTVPEFWPEYNETSRQFMNLGDKPEVQVQDSDRMDRYNWWNNDFYDLVEKHKTTDGAEQDMVQLENIISQKSKHIMTLFEEVGDSPEKVMEILKKAINSEMMT